MYKRITTDVYEVQGNYGYGDGFEYLIAYDTYKEAKECVKLYRENENQAIYRVVKKREKIQ